jgi:hypothetical protein
MYLFGGDANPDDAKALETTQAKVGVFAAAGAAGEWPTHFDLHLVVGAWEYVGMVVGRLAVSQGNR